MYHKVACRVFILTVQDFIRGKQKRRKFLAFLWVLRRALWPRGPFQFLANAMNTFSFFIHTRHVILPKDIARKVPKKLMTEKEWRSLGVQQSQGWEHYMRHDPGRLAH